MTNLASIVVDGENVGIALGPLIKLGMHRQVLMQLFNQRGVRALPS